MINFLKTIDKRRTHNDVVLVLRHDVLCPRFGATVIMNGLWCVFLPVGSLPTIKDHIRRQMDEARMAVLCRLGNMLCPKLDNFNHFWSPTGTRRMDNDIWRKVTHQCTN